ncbi:unnamed protein product [Durusdinium trenchii]|uniref:Anaphase-promoting complex subunit 5 n=2 Tax=Durusdinium trenchii TaxID=1381693 RepID=A0ABP0MJ65_9DINO
MEATEYFVPPGCDFLDAAGETPTDGLAQLFSLEADAATPEQRSRAARAAALLFSLAERALLTAERVEELEKAQHTAVEAWHLFMADGDFHSAAWSARTVIHALRARSCACGGTGARFAAAAVALAEEELRRARLSGDDFGEACFLMSMAELHCDAKNLDEGLRCAEAASAAFLRCGAIPATAAAGRVLVVLVLGELQVRRYQFHEAEAAAQQALRLLDASEDAGASACRARAGLLLGVAGRLQQKHAAVIASTKEAIPWAQETGDLRLLAALMYLLASSSHSLGGRFRAAAAAAGEAQRLWEQMELRASGWAQCALSLQTQALLAETSHDAAKEALRQHMRTARGPGPRVLLRDAWVQCLKRLDGPGDREKAHAISDKTLATLQSTSELSSAWEARELELIASIHVKSNSWKKVEEACKWAEQAKQKLHGSGDKYLEADAIPSIAKCYILLGRPSDAASVLSERRQLFRELGARSREAEAMLDLADALCKEQVSRVDSRARRFLRDAFQICQEALNAFSDVGQETGMAKAHLLLADIYMHRQEPSEAEHEARQAEQLYRRAGESKKVAKAVRKLGFACCEQDRPSAAARCASEAVVFCRKAGDRYATAEMLSWEAQCLGSQRVRLRAAAFALRH